MFESRLQHAAHRRILLVHHFRVDFLAQEEVFKRVALFLLSLDFRFFAFENEVLDVVVGKENGASRRKFFLLLQL